MLSSFCRELESELDAISKAADGVRDQDKRSRLLGSSLRRARSAPALSGLWKELVSTATESVPSSRCSATDLTACLASCFTEMCTRHQKKNRRVRLPCPQSAPPLYELSQLTESQRRKVAYHAGWTLVRVRENVARTKSSHRFLSAASSADTSEVSCTKTDVLTLISRLGKDVQKEDGTHNFVVAEECNAFYIALHNTVAALLSDDGIRQHRSELLQYTLAQLAVHKDLRREWNRLWKRLDEPVSAGTTVLLREICR